MLPSHNCIIIINVQFSRYILSFKKLNEISIFIGISVNFPTSSLFTITYYLKKWWAKMDSNHRPHDYQSCALAS